MGVTLLSPDQFMLEARRWGIDDHSLIRVRMMRVGDVITCRFHVPHTFEIVETKLTVDEYQKFQFINLAHIAVPAVWKDDSTNLKEIEKRLTDLNSVMGGKPNSPAGFPGVYYG